MAIKGSYGLTPDEVQLVRKLKARRHKLLKAAQMLTDRALAARFSVTHRTIGRANAGDTYNKVK